MATRNIYTDTGILQADDSAATPSSAMLRDANGDAVARRLSVLRAMLTGGVTANVSNQTTSFTASLDKVIYTVDTSGGSVTVTLPAASTSTGALLVFIKTSASNNLVLDANSTENISGSATVTATANYAVRAIVCNGTEWFTIASV